MELKNKIPESQEKTIKLSAETIDSLHELLKHSSVIGRRIQCKASICSDCPIIKECSAHLRVFDAISDYFKLGGLDI